MKNNPVKRKSRQNLCIKIHIFVPFLVNRGVLSDNFNFGLLLILDPLYLSSLCEILCTFTLSCLFKLKFSSVLRNSCEKGIYHQGVRASCPLISTDTLI